MAETWKNSLPVLFWLVIFMLVQYFKVPYEGFYGGLIIGIGWFLLIPLLESVGVAKSALQWFSKAGILAVFSAAFGLVGFTLLKTGAWWTLIVEFGLLASGFFAFIGALVSFFKWKS